MTFFAKLANLAKDSLKVWQKKLNETIKEAY